MSSKLKLTLQGIVLIVSAVFITVNIFSILNHPYTSLSAAALGWGVGNYKEIKETFLRVKNGLF